MLSYPEPRAQPASPRRQRIYYGWYVVAAAVIISAAVGGASDSLSIFQLPMSQELGWNYSFLVIVPLIGVLMNGLAQPVLGHLIDRSDARKVICISIAVAGLATVGLSWTSYTWHLIFLFGIVFSGAMSGASVGVLGPLAARWFLKRRTLVLSLLMAATALGSIFSPLSLFSSIVIASYGWREAYIALGAVLLFIALPSALIFVRNWPSDRGLKPDGGSESPMEARMRGSAPVFQLGQFEVVRWWRAFRSPPFWALLPVFAIGGFTTAATPALFDSIAVDVYKVGPELVMVVHAVMEASGLIGVVVVGLIADRFPRKKVLGALLLAQGVAFLVSIASPWYLGLLLSSVLAGLSGTAWMLIALSMIADIYGVRALATLWGIAFLFHTIGRIIGSVLVGTAIVLIDTYSLPFIACASMLVPSSISVFRINERKYSARYQAAVES